jgi:general secretion pathway protein D
LAATLLGIGAVSAALFFNSPLPVEAQTQGRPARRTVPPGGPGNVAEGVPASVPVAAVRAEASPAAPSAPPSVAGAIPPGAVPPGAMPPGAMPGGAGTEVIDPNEDIQLSFQGANIDMIVQWLAKMTGKSVVKHPRVQCQLTIVSSKKLAPRDAINLVYRALSLENFTTVESANSILIVPEGSEPKTSPELVSSDAKEMPQGRQKLIKIFPLNHIPGSELKEKIKAVLSDKGTIEAADRSNQVIVTDYTDNIRLAGELIKELDIPSSGDSVVEFFTLKHSEAEELGELLTLVLNAQSGSPTPKKIAQPPRSSNGPMMDGMPMNMPMPGPPPSAGPGAASAGGPQQVRIWPDKTSNRLIVAAPKSRIAEIQKLIDILDTEKPQDVSIRVIQLKNVNSDDIVKEIVPLYQKLTGKGTKDVVEVTGDSRSNSLIVLSSEATFKAIEKLIATLDTDDAQEKAMRTFSLKNADAEDVAKQIQDLNQDQDSQNRYPYYFFSSSMNQKNTKKISVVADRRRNTVVVQAPANAMDNIEKMIKALDEPITDNGLAPKIFRMKFVSATDIEDVLNELFLKKSQPRTYWDPYNQPPADTSGNQGGRLYGKVRITSEPYSNAIIVTSNSPENLAAVEEVLKQLDVPSDAGDTTLRVGLKFAKASIVASSINILFAKGGSPPLRPVAQPGQPQDNRQPQQQTSTSQNNFGLQEEPKDDGYFPWLGGQQEISSRGIDGKSASRPVSDLVGRVRIVPDKRSNSLLITCNVHFFPQVMKLINELDEPTPQVLIEAKIIEVSGDFRDRLGVRWSPDGSKTFSADDMDNSLLVKSSAAYKKVFAGNAMADSLRTGILDTSLNLDFLVQFLRKNTDAKVLAEPQINIADNELGKLFVGSQVPFISGSLNTDVGGRNDTFQYRDVGIILEVTPHINDAQEVALKIRAESSSIRSGETLFGGAILDTRNFRTDLMVKSGETIVLGGIIQREQIDTMRKVPWLGNIPGLGWAFKKKDNSSREVELMVFLRPHVTRSPEETRELLEQVQKKTPLIKKWETNAPSNEVLDPNRKLQK